MALSFTQTISRAPRAGTIKPGGLRVAVIELTTSTGSGGADYSSGFAISTNASKFGFRNIVAVIGLSAVKADGTTPLGDKVMFTYDTVNGKLRVWRGLTAGANWTLSEDQGTALDAGATVRMLVIGV